MTIKKDIKDSFVVRAPSSLRKRLLREAKARGISANQLCVERLEAPFSTATRKEQIFGLAREQLFSAVRKFMLETVIPTFESDLVGLVLFGSFVRGRLRPNSDVDLLVVLRSETNFDRDTYSRLPKCVINGHAVSPLIVCFPQNMESSLGSVWMEIAIEGIVFYDVEFQLSRLLAKLRLKIAGGEVQRKFSHGVPYWIHQQERIDAN